MTAAPAVPDPTDVIDQLSAATWTLAAIGVLFESGLARELLQPRTLEELAASCPALPAERIARCLAVAARNGFVVLEGARYALTEGARAYAQPPALDALRGGIRSDLMQANAYLDSATRGARRGWRHEDPVLLQAQGDNSSQFAFGLARRIAPQLGDLSARLASPGARLLDVGTGVASLSIALCRAFPHASVVGLDVADVPLSLARQNVARAGLEERVELRKLAAQDLRDEAAFDLAWLPSIFLPSEVVPAAIARVRAALRPGGYLLMPALSASVPAPRRELAELLLELWGHVLEADTARRLLSDAGFAAPRLIPGPSWMTLAVAER
jgi:ubiquinone/menaquinone biosynthesis C-methylase UbiE